MIFQVGKFFCMCTCSCQKPENRFSVCAGPSLWHAGSPLQRSSVLSLWRVVSSGCRLQPVSLWSLEHLGSVVSVQGLSCPVALGIFVPCPGIKTTSRTLEGGFLLDHQGGPSFYHYYYFSPCRVACVISSDHAVKTQTPNH